MFACFSANDLLIVCPSVVCSIAYLCRSSSLKSMPLTSPDRPLYLTFVAGFVGTVGYGLSVMAVWLGQLIPYFVKSEQEPVVPQSRPRNPRRQSAPGTLQFTLAPVSQDMPRPILNSAARRMSGPPHRHVYFVDSPESEMPGPTADDASDNSIPFGPNRRAADSRSLTDESIAESDNSSSRSCSSKSGPRLPNFIRKGIRKASGKKGGPAESADLSHSDASASPQPSPSVRVADLPPESDSTHESLTTPTPTPMTRSATCGEPVRTRKRSSTLPVNSIQPLLAQIVRRNKPPQPDATNPPRRTHPYEYPYFATPPSSPSEFRASDDSASSAEQIAKAPKNAGPQPVVRSRTQGATPVSQGSRQSPLGKSHPVLAPIKALRAASRSVTA